jgi:hypothetical protein
MSLLPEIPNPYLEALAVGLLYGLVFCTSTCLLYIAGATILIVLGISTIVNAINVASH